MLGEEHLDGAKREDRRGNNLWAGHAGMATSELDWYSILGVDPAASDAEIGRAFRSLARRYHPDVGPNPSDVRFSDVARAWEILGDPSSRANYDRRRRGDPAGGVQIPVRRWATSPRQPPVVDPTIDDDGEHPDIEVSVSFIEALGGSVAKVSLPRSAACAECAGTGRRSSGACRQCGGRGRLQRQSGSIAINHICSACEGSGALPPQPCGACRGLGWQEQHRELTIKVPAGVSDGTRLRMRWPSSGQPAGYARVRVRPDEWFSRDGADIVLRLPLGVSEAALGCTIAASLPDGPVDIVVQPGTQPGDRIRVAGRGVPGRPGGCLVAVVEVAIPRHPRPEAIAALEALGAASPDPRKDWPASTPASKPVPPQ